MMMRCSAPFLAPVATCLAAALVVASCGRTSTGEETDASDAPEMTTGVGTPVHAAVETIAVGTANADAADDPAIWVDPGNRDRALVFGSDKKAGLYVYKLDGSVHQHLDGGMPNNVDLRSGFVVDGRPQVLVAASDRSKERFGIALFLMDPDSLQTRFWGVIPTDLVEPYGLCLGRRGNSFVAIVDGTDGQVRQLRIAVGADGKPAATEEQRYAVGSQTEGCVIDDRTGQVYIGEEAKGIWRYPLDPKAGARRARIATAPSAELTPDVEGLTLMRDGARTWLLASSQGDSAFAVWQVDGPPRFAGRFSVVAGGGIDAVTGTDGIDALGGPIGPYAAGVVAVQDDLDEAPGRTGERQNFKFIDWREIRRALKLEQ
ncbi:MAG TPA: phytase [Sphingomicrobium sp.]|jgi:3-phytase|nr:phytase [Sphingomicrobium sp.]